MDDHFDELNKRFLEILDKISDKEMKSANKEKINRLRNSIVKIRSEILK